MEIEQSSLYREVQAIIASANNPVHSAWVAEVHANGMTYRALKVLSVDMVCDFENNYADEIIVTLALPGGTYAKRIYPFQSNLDVTLYKIPLQEVGDSLDQERQIESERYTATLLDSGNPIMESNAGSALTEDALNLTNIFTIQFQLVNKALEQLRMISWGQIYRRSTVEDVAKLVLTQGSQMVKVDGVRLPQGVDMIEASNKTQRDHIIIPHGVPVVEVPSYLQAKCGGIYSAGLGYYLQGDYWYLYPCYDVTRFNNAPRTMTIINVPKNKFPDIERTYRKDGSNIVVLATGEVSMKTDNDSLQLNQGNGVRFADASRFMEDFSKTENNSTIISRGSNNNEFMSVGRQNGNNNIRSSENAIHANPYVEYSKLARRQGAFLTMVWENSNPTEIFPGMMIKVLYLDQNDIKEVYGVVLKAHHFVHLKGQGLTASRYRNNTALSIFVQSDQIN
jgi:hypothetical protein